jgi:hypothetical protein
MGWDPRALRTAGRQVRIEGLDQLGTTGLGLLQVLNLGFLLQWVFRWPSQLGLARPTERLFPVAIGALCPVGSGFDRLWRAGGCLMLE